MYKENTIYNFHMFWFFGIVQDLNIISHCSDSIYTKLIVTESNFNN